MIRARLCYQLVVKLPLPWRLMMALLPYAGEWAYRDEASPQGEGK